MIDIFLKILTWKKTKLRWRPITKWNKDWAREREKGWPIRDDGRNERPTPCKVEQEEVKQESESIPRLSGISDYFATIPKRLGRRHNPALLLPGWSSINKTTVAQLDNHQCAPISKIANNPLLKPTTWKWVWLLKLFKIPSTFHLNYFNISVFSCSSSPLSSPSLLLPTSHTTQNRLTQHPTHLTPKPTTT